MACCRCNCSGRCQNCLCVKSGRVCQGCLPQRLGNCVNTVWTPPSQVAANIASLSPVSSSPGPSSSSPFSPHTSPRLSPELLSSPEHHSEVATLRVAVTPQVHDSASEKVLELPAFLPATSPGVPVTLPLSLTSSMMFMVKLCIGGQIFSKFPLARLENALFLNLQDCAFASSYAMASIAMKAITVLPILLLQKPSAKSKAKEHSAFLERCLDTWLNGDLSDLLLEGRTIQRRIPKSNPEDRSALHAPLPT